MVKATGVRRIFPILDPLVTCADRSYDAAACFLAGAFAAFFAVVFLLDVLPLFAAHLAFIRSLRRFRPASESRPFLAALFLAAPVVLPATGCLGPREVE